MSKTKGNIAGRAAAAAAVEAANEVIPKAEPSTTSRRVLRYKYRELKKDVDSKKGHLAGTDKKEFKEILDAVDSLHQYAVKAKEQIVDAELLNAITSELHDAAKGSRLFAGFNVVDLISCVHHRFALPGYADADQKVRYLNWSALGLEACDVFQDCGGVTTMIGPMDVELKEVKTLVPGSRKRVRPGPNIKPEEAKDCDGELFDRQTASNISTMFRALGQRKGVELSSLVLNRLSFGQTVENLFALSFLVKDGRVASDFDDKGNEIVTSRNGPSHQQRTSGEVLNSQYMFRFGKDCWRKMQAVVKPGEEVMPHRVDPST